MLINRQNLSLLFTGFKTLFNEAFESTPSQYKDVAMEVPSSTSQETYAWLGSMPGFREWIGEREVRNLATSDFTIKNRDFEMTVGVDRNSIQDDNIGIYSPMMRSLGEASKTHPDSLVFPLLLNGFTSLCYDGQYFFDTDHPVLDANGVEQSVSNHGGGASTPWYLLDVSRAIRPLIFQKRSEYSLIRMDNPDDENVFMRKEFIYGVDTRVNAGYGLWQLAFGSKQTLNAANYGAARAAMMGIKKDGGEPMNVRPTLLVVPPSLEAAGLEVLQAERNAAGATNVYRNTAKLLVSPFLA